MFPSVPIQPEPILTALALIAVPTLLVFLVSVGVLMMLAWEMVRARAAVAVPSSPFLDESLSMHSATVAPTRRPAPSSFPARTSVGDSFARGASSDR